MIFCGIIKYFTGYRCLSNGGYFGYSFHAFTFKDALAYFKTRQLTFKSHGCVNFLNTRALATSRLEDPKMGTFWVLGRNNQEVAQCNLNLFGSLKNPVLKNPPMPMAKASFQTMPASSTLGSWSRPRSPLPRSSAVTSSMVT